MQCGEGQFHLGLATRGARYPAARRICGQIIKQRCLANTRFTGHDQCPTLTSANCRDELIEHPALGVTVNHLHRPTPPPGMALLRKKTDALAVLTPERLSATGS